MCMAGLHAHAILRKLAWVSIFAQKNIIINIIIHRRHAVCVMVGMDQMVGLHARVICADRACAKIA